ncbi:hypothetical protein [Streptomyces endophyticus]|uniref:Uncharacterized protein n=1 Tax=Streptomyces endophyticus TaxID=714166 RepID=A0ABU6FF27_9ACTN|nr:hypothetical protein [Streptomyces endophyticus]MEB8342599.1 hypothetical protein [Streptomyces endophyticus]
MEPVTLIATALAAGAAAGTQDAVSESVRGAYRRLYELVRGRLTGRSGELDGAVEAQRARNASDDDPVAPELRQLLVLIDAAHDQQLQSLADVVLQRPEGPTVDTSNSNGWNVWNSNNKGVQNGPHGWQQNTFNS